MDAASLFDAVKDCREVWEAHLDYDERESDPWSLHYKSNPPILPDDAELLLEALLARATGLGAYEADEGFFSFSCNDRSFSSHQPSRLSALAAAYRSGVRA